MAKKNKKGFKWLGSQNVRYPTKPGREIIEIFENRHKNRKYTITFDCPEYTSVCPITGQPDFATIKIEYCPDKTCIEAKSLKLYLFSYRNEGIFFETAVNQILDDLVWATKPREMTVRGIFNVRGGIGMVVEAGYPNKSATRKKA